MQRKIALGLIVVVLIAVAAKLVYRPFPSDRTPEGAYMRVAHAVLDDRVKDVFPYLETEAQWATYTIRGTRGQACARVKASYPPGAGTDLLHAYCPLGDAADGSDVFALLARQRGWVARLRRDLSGVVRVEVEGERASVVTARGTRYPFRRRDNGIWGLTIFTAELVAESERASRDLAVVSAAGDDYDRARRPAP